MATPVSLFRPNGPTRLDVPKPPTVEESVPSTPPLTIDVIEPPPAPRAEGAAVELDTRIAPGGEINLAKSRQKISLRGYAGRTVTVWADLRSIHISLDGHQLRTVSSRLLPADLRYLTMRGARPAGPPPGNTHDRQPPHQRARHPSRRR